MSCLAPLEYSKVGIDGLGKVEAAKSPVTISKSRVATSPQPMKLKLLLASIFDDEVDAMSQCIPIITCRLQLSAEV